MSAALTLHAFRSVEAALRRAREIRCLHYTAVEPTMNRSGRPLVDPREAQSRAHARAGIKIRMEPVDPPFVMGVGAGGRSAVQPRSGRAVARPRFQLARRDTPSQSGHYWPGHGVSPP